MRKSDDTGLSHVGASQSVAALGAGTSPVRAVPHVSICVLTFRRLEMLIQCLESLRRQEIRAFTCSIIVVDNDAEGSAKAAVEESARRSCFRLEYVIEPVQNIALARNRAVQSTSGEFIAFIDDDEVAEPDWLARLVETCESQKVDGVLGPVVPKFEGTPPTWLVKSGLCSRTEFSTGTALVNSRYMRTGNVIFKRCIVSNHPTPFDSRFGRTGGEDADFFDRMLLESRRFIWDNEARVHEWVPRERQRLAYHVRRGLLRGVAEAKRHPILSVDTAKSVAALGVYAVLLPILLIVDRAYFARIAVSSSDHGGKLLAHLGLPIARQRMF